MKERLIVVEDDEPVRKFIILALERGGYKAEGAEDATQALAALGNDGNRFDLAVIDIGLPLMNGKDLAKKIKESWPAMKILFISGHGDEQVKDFVERSDFLQKPFLPSELQKMVKRMLANGSSRRNQAA